MNGIPIVLAALLGLTTAGQVMSSDDGSRVEAAAIDFLTAFQVVWMYDQEKLGMDLNDQFYLATGDPLFAINSASNSRCMAELIGMIELYDLRDMFGDVSDEPAAFIDERHLQAYVGLLARGQESLQAAYYASASVEEWNIFEYRNDIAAIDEGQCSPCETLQPLRDAYEMLLGEAYVKFVRLASRLPGYEAQLLSQEAVDAIMDTTVVPAIGEFGINVGLVDAWHNPEAPGQGFFITVYERHGIVFMSWLTFDTAPPGQSEAATIGAAGQRWLPAQGPYDGARAELVVYSSSGGLFNASPPVPALEPVGSIVLEFEDCATGSVDYDLPGAGASGTIPIERVAPDNAVFCESLRLPIW
jgi:hypothetical protein